MHIGSGAWWATAWDGRKPPNTVLRAKSDGSAAQLDLERVLTREKGGAQGCALIRCAATKHSR